MADQPTENIFNSEPTQETQNAATAPAPEQEPSAPEPFADLLGSITAEDGRQKYSDVATALNSIPAAQSHISRLEQENAEMKERLAKAEAVKETLDRLEATNKGSEQPSQPELDVSQLDSLLEAKLIAKEQAAREKANVSEVISAMSKQFGEKAEEVFISAAKESGLSVEHMNKLAASSPSAVFKLVGIGNSYVAPAQTSGSVNTESMQPVENKPSVKVKMNGSSTKDVLAAWRAAAPN